MSCVQGCLLLQQHTCKSLNRTESHKIRTTSTIKTTIRVQGAAALQKKSLLFGRLMEVVLTFCTNR